jgi:hypothetical protein
MTQVAHLLAATLCCSLGGMQSQDQPADMRAELPRDLRIILLGVPSVRDARGAEQNVQKALRAMEDAISEEVSAVRMEKSRARVCFHLGQLDQALAALSRLMREVERVKGLEEYGTFARQLELKADSVRALCGASDAPVIVEDDELDSQESADFGPQDFVRRVNGELADIHAVLARVELKSQPDEERKAELERDFGGVGQFAFYIKNLVDKLKVAEDQPVDVTIDSNEIMHGVQSIIAAVRNLKQQKASRPATEGREPRDRRIQTPKTAP